MTELGIATPDDGSESPTPQAGSIWPHVEEQIVDLVLDHRSSIVFANSPPRRTIDSQAQRDSCRTHRSGRRENISPARADRGSHRGQLRRRTPARAHHGSVSKDQRALIEDDLKSGRLRCVVATSSLELGIDMGAVDLVIQVEAPPSVASGLQRVGRAGHQVGEISRGVVFPKHRTDLIHCAVTVERMVEGKIEAMAVPANPSTSSLSKLLRPPLSNRSTSTTGSRRCAEAVPLQRFPVRRTNRLWTCWRGGTPRTSSPSYVLALSGIVSPTRSRAARVRSVWPSLPAAQSPTAASSPSTWLARKRPASANSTRKWSTNPGSATSLRSAPPVGGSRRSPSIGFWSAPPTACRVVCPSGTATDSVAPPNSDRRWDNLFERPRWVTKPTSSSVVAWAGSITTPQPI
ncbi:helicase-related protein [Rhodococcus sp. 3Y1]